MKYLFASLILSISILPSLVEAKNLKDQPKQKHHVLKTVVKKPIVKTVKKNKTNKLVGVASWYGYESVKKRKPKTANGEIFLPSKMTAAHRTLPFGTKVKVTNLDNNKSVVVVINDRGPFVYGRIIDLSKGAARAIGMFGTQKVSLTIVS